MKYLQINDDGYTPCGKWRVVPTKPTDAMLRNAYDNQLNYKLGVIASPTPPAELLLSGEPVGYAHKIRKVDFIHKDVKELMDRFYAEHGFHSQTDRPPIKTTEHYTIPVYLHPAPDSDTVRDAERYRWLRFDASAYQAQTILNNQPDAIDAAIDAVRGAK